MLCYVCARTRHRKDGRGTVSQQLRRTLPRTPARDGRRPVCPTSLPAATTTPWPSAADCARERTRPARAHRARPRLTPPSSSIVVMGMLGLAQPGIRRGLAAAGERRLVATGNVAGRTVWRAASGSAPGALRSRPRSSSLVAVEAPRPVRRRRRRSSRRTAAIRRRRSAAAASAPRRPPREGADGTIETSGRVGVAMSNSASTSAPTLTPGSTHRGRAPRRVRTCAAPTRREHAGNIGQSGPRCGLGSSERERSTTPP